MTDSRCRDKYHKGHSHHDECTFKETHCKDLGMFGQVHGQGGGGLLMPCGL